MSDEIYKGWTNHATWATHRWITGNESNNRYWQSAAHESESVADLADKLEQEITAEANEALGSASLFADLLISVLETVNYREIAEALKSS